MNIIRAEGIMRLYSTTYLASARGGASIQKAMKITGRASCVVVSSGSAMYTEGPSLVKSAKGFVREFVGSAAMMDAVHDCLKLLGVGRPRRTPEISGTP